MLVEEPISLDAVWQAIFSLVRHTGLDQRPEDAGVVYDLFAGVRSLADFPEDERLKLSNAAAAVMLQAVNQHLPASGQDTHWAVLLPQHGRRVETRFGQHDLNEETLDEIFARLEERGSFAAAARLEGMRTAVYYAESARVPADARG